MPSAAKSTATSTGPPSSRMSQFQETLEKHVKPIYNPSLSTKSLDSGQKRPEKVPLTKVQYYWSYVPTCGGWCLPTASPEVTCLRHFSNEYTMFKFFADWAWVRAWFEHSKVCRRAGGLGLSCSERFRTWLMLLALICSLSSWAFIVCAAFGMSKTDHILEKLPWSAINWEDSEGLGVKFDVFFGVRAVYTRLTGVAPHNGTNTSVNALDVYAPGNVIERTFNFGEACDEFKGRYTVPSSQKELHEFCVQCKDTSVRTQVFMWMAILIQFFQVRKNLQRLTPYGDMNCQKFMGWAAALIGIATGVASITSYIEGCSRHFPDTMVMNLLSPKTGAHVEVDAGNNHLGLGIILLLTAVCLKFIDFLAHFCLRSPTAKQEHTDPNIHFIDYCFLNGEPTKFGQPINENPKLATA